ncbi:MAG: hypothetical protein ACPH27_08330, partial [Pseudomonadales bacterium]
MSNRITQANLSIDSQLHNLLVDEILPGLNIDAEQVWQTMATLLEEFQARNGDLLAQRQALQAKIDNWHDMHPQGNAA